jgi:hypothetical protein
MRTPFSFGQQLNRRLLLSMGLILLGGSLLMPPTSRRVFYLRQTGYNEYVTDEVGRLTILAPVWAPGAGRAVFSLTRFAAMQGPLITEGEGPFALFFWLFIEAPIIAAAVTFVAYKARRTRLQIPHALRLALVLSTLTLVFAPKYEHGSVSFGPIWNGQSCYGILAIEWLFIIVVASLRGIHKGASEVPAEKERASGAL